MIHTRIMRGRFTSVLATTSKISCRAATTFSSTPFTWEQARTWLQERRRPQKEGDDKDADVNDGNDRNADDTDDADSDKD